MVRTVDLKAKTITLDGDLFKNLKISFSDKTKFSEGKSAADLVKSSKISVKGTVTGKTLDLAYIRIYNAEEHLPGIVALEADGNVSNIVKVSSVITSLDISGRTFAVTTDTKRLVADKDVIDGAKVRVLFKQTTGTSSAGAKTINVALLIGLKR